MTYDTIITLVLARARRLGLKNPDSGLVDAADCEVAVFSALVDLVGTYDLDGFTVPNPAMFVTTAGVDEYALPEDFGRFITPRDEKEYGIGVYDGSSLAPLTKQSPEEMLRLRQTTNAKPAYYTLTAYGRIKLSPTPDANSGTNYTGRGVYIRDITPEELDTGTVPVAYAAALEKIALAQLCEDLGHPTTPLKQGARTQGLSVVVNHQERQRLRFQRKHTQLGRNARWS